MFAQTVKWLFTAVCVLTLVRADSGCIFGSFDLSSLSPFDPWVSKDGNTTYTLSLCGAQRELAPGCPVGTTVCNQTSGHGAIVMGTRAVTNFSADNPEADLLVFTYGGDCAEMPGEKMVSIIYFKCAKSLGSPVFLGSHACAAYFEWRSHAVCKDLTKPVKEVPCHAYDGSKKYDLSPLMKDSGGYSVTSSDGSTEITFNVCRDIDVHPAEGDPHCGGGVASCRFSVGADGARTPRNMGEPQTGVTVDSQGHLQLRYSSSATPAGCVGNSTTTINFLCPTRGGSQDPKLVSDMLCNNVIEWQTEYACPETKLKSSTCQLTQETHDIDIDLSPLKGENFQVTTADYIYALRMCEDLTVPCNGSSSSFTTHTAACQMSTKNSDQNWDMGHSNHMELSYVDGDLTLTYKDGAPCHTGFRRETIIALQCNLNAANGGKGTPTFRKEEACTYLFDWETKYACLDHPVEMCSITSGKQQFDLSSLTRESGLNWVALTDREGKEEAKFFINVCHDLLQTGEASNCPTDSSICLKESSGAVKSLGKYTAKSNPVYDASTNSIKINYFDGSQTEDGTKINTTITLTCSPGNLESAPVLAEAPPQGWQSHYEFTWRTAAACPLSHKAGQNCRVDDDSAGFMFDLSPLTRTPDKPYKVTTADYDFYLNVCGSVTGTACDNGHTNAAICQVSKSSPVAAFKLGEPSDKLSYYDGMINLTYTNGDPYNDVAKTPRKAEIAFRCDPDAGTGTPQFLTESQSTYTFQWNTALACPAQPIECVVVDQLSGQEYDLSGLAQSSDNWAVEDTSGTPVKKFYLNVCRPVISPHIKGGGTCDAFAAVCATDITAGQETLLHSNLGQAADGPVVAPGQTGQLTLTYSHGGACTLSNGTATTFTTTIHFVCKQGELSKGPQPPRQVNECEFSFLWETEGACPKADHTQGAQDDCKVKDTDSDFTFDLSPLTKKTGFYTTNSTDGLRTFRLNICGGVTVGTGGCDGLESQTGAPGLCEVQPSRRPALAEANSKLTLSPSGQLSLTYEGGRVNLERSSLTITFICNRNPAQEGPGPVSQESQNYRLQFFTPLACPPQPVDCTVQDSQGRQVDLSPLARSDANWVITDSRDSHSNLRYFINVCRPLVPVLGTSCPGGAVGGCQHGAESFNLGYIQAKPTMAADGSVTLRYQGGTVCHQGTDKEALRSMRINFICSAIERAPRFVEETDVCEYIFSWETPSACPVKQDVGHDCKVRDSLYNHEFDLSPLKKAGSDYRVQDGEYEYLISLCGPLQQGSEACTGRSGVGVCQTKPKSDQSFNVPAGNANGDLVYSLGEITLTYSDGKANCHGQYNRSTVITFVCDHGQDGSTGPTFLKEDFDCTYMFEWKTKLACPPFSVSDCTQVQGNKQYDFSGLARTDDNYETELFSQQKKFYINVCKPVVPQKGMQCPYDAAICMASMTEMDPSKKFHSLGKSSESPVEVQGQILQIRYTGGEPCGGNRTTSSVLVMLCDPNAIDTEPELPYRVSDCEWHFSWKTALACENAVSANTTGANCRTRNPVSGYEFDLSGLRKDEGYFSDDLAGHTYLINVCGPLASSANKCSDPQSGSCQNETMGEKRFFSSGVANGNLVYEGDGVLTLTYSGGEVCHHNKVARTTVISFYCSQGAGNGHPVYVSMTDGCTYYFNWPTDLACEQQVECKVDVGNYTVDLSPLVRPVGHYQARNMVNDGAVYYVNLCRPLNPIFGQQCPPGSAVCMSRVGQSPKNLGRVSGEPTLDPNTGHVTLTYSHGEKCAEDPSKNISTLIVFHCKPGSQEGDLQLDSAPTGNSCTYVFTWETSAVCAPDASVSEGSSCSFTDTQHGQVYDLSALKAPVEVSGSAGATFRLQVCGGLSGGSDGCQGAAVCRNAKDSYGLASTGTFAMQEDDLGLTFNQGRQCGLGKASAQVIFECSQEAGEGRPELTQSGDCFVAFRWKTSYVCPPATAPCTLQHGADFFDLTPLSQTSSSWKHKDASGNVYWINLCQGLHGEALTRGCQPNAAVCQVSSTGVTNVLGTVATQQLSVEAGGGLLLEYSQGVCGGGRRRSEHQQASARIHLQCADTIGAPVLQPRKDQDICTFDFLWKSRLACKEANKPTVIQDVNHVLKDPRTGLTINLNSKGLSEEKVYREAGSQFHISLVGKVARDKQLTESHACDGASVCLSKPSDSKFYRDLGQYDSRKYYVEDDVFEVQYESHEMCPGSQNTKIKTIISFKCSTDGTEGQPDLMSNAGDCVYIFHWYTSLACLRTQVSENPAVVPGGTDPSKTAQNTGKSPVSSKTVGIVVGVFVSVAVICIILVVFHKRETREAFAFRVKNVVLCRKTPDQGIKYSVLSQSEEEVLEQDGDVEEGIRATGGAVFLSADSVQTEGMGNLNTYHDDSDDDLLL